MNTEHLYTSGFVPNLPEAVYHSDPCGDVPALSASIAKKLWQKSAAHARLAHPKLGADGFGPSKAMDDGSIIHELLLGKGAGYRELDFPDFRTKASKDARDAARSEGLTPVLTKNFEALTRAANQIRARLSDDFGIAIDAAPDDVELSVFWQEGGAQCRGRFDLFHRTDEKIVITDLKTTANAHPRKVAKTIDDFGYDIQRGAYVSAVETLLPEYIGRVEYQWLFVETAAPYCVTPARESEALATLGRDKWRQCVAQWVDCLSSDRWPGYVTEPIIVSPTPWALREFYEEGEE